MELFLTDDIYVCPLMINTFEDIVRKSRSEIKNIIFKKKNIFFHFIFQDV